MAREIERKFLVQNDGWREAVSKSIRFKQGYLNEIYTDHAKSSVRVRIEGDQANINIKSLEIGLSRDEFEYPIPLADAEHLLDKLAIGPLIEKNRHFVEIAGKVWEIDEFFGDNAGLIVAEIELEDEQESFAMPAWAGQEITPDLRYYNVSLSQNPYKNWKDE